MDDWDVIVIGAGAAGLMAASRAAQRGRRTLLVEKKKRPGAKILMSGGSRCNITHAVDARGIVEAYAEQGPFLHSALAALSPEQLVDLIEAEGVKTKIEPTGKIFPQSDRAGDVLAALMAILRRTSCELACDEPVLSLGPYASGLRVVTSKRTMLAESVIVTTGGKSFPSSGSTGDGYAWAADLGHTIIPPRPALVPIKSSAAWLNGLQGITLADVRVTVVEVDRIAEAVPECLAERRASLLFTHFGVSGPAALDVSRAVSGHPLAERLLLRCDLLPDNNAQLLEADIQQQCQQAGGRLAGGVFARYVPQRLAELIAALSGIGRDRRAAELSRRERQQLVAGLKQFEIPISGTLGFNKAEVTAGGVALNEVDSRTMESRMTPGLYFAGEILDLDGPIGGFNFQAAFSSGWLAGENA
jgi:predicted Rossmann fold flavoprotein